MRWNTYIARKILASGGYGLLYNWFATQQQVSVKYGALYNWYATTDARNIAASGMDVPTRANFITLETSLGGSTAAGGHLKETGFVWWNSPNTGADNSSQMNVRGNGYRAGDTGIFAPLNSVANLWTKDEYSLDTTKGRYFQAATYNYATSVSNIVSLKSSGFSLRLVRLATTEELLLSDGIISATYTGNDGKLYRLCKVGIQIWLADNLAETKYRNGDWIHGYDGGVYTPISDATWAASTTGARCSHNNTESNAGSIKSIISSANWKIPWFLEFYSITAYKGWDWPSGGHYKEIGTTHWMAPNYGADNSLGFSAMPSGMRVSTGLFSGLSEMFSMWNGDNSGSWKGSILIWTNYDDGIGGSVDNVNQGASIRLMRPTSTEELVLPDGLISSKYIGNNLVEYDCIKIGPQIYTVQSLKETKWSDGTDIQNVTDNTAWSLLQSAACCDVNNDPTKR